MAPFSLAWRAFAVAIVVALASMTPARANDATVGADDATVGELQVRLVESRQHLNDLHAQSAAASERLNGAVYELRQAKKSLAQHRVDLALATRRLAEQVRAVAGLTVEQIQSGSSAARLLSVFDGVPRVLLERASAYSSTGEAMSALVSDLSARRVMHVATTHQAEDALDVVRAAAARRKAAQAAIDDAIARAEAADAALVEERQTLLVELAEAQGLTLEEVTQAQDQIDNRLDEAGPGGATAAPAPTVPFDPPATAGGKTEKAVAFARAQLGEPYVWGGAGPSTWDCSGLTMRAWQAAGVSLPHYAGAQYAKTTPVPVSKIRRGDLLFWSKGGPGSIYHEALYLGGGKMIHAPRPGRNVEIVPISYWISPDLASRAG